MKVAISYRCTINVGPKWLYQFRVYGMITRICDSLKTFIAYCFAVSGDNNELFISYHRDWGAGINWHTCHWNKGIGTRGKEYYDIGVFSSHRYAHHTIPGLMLIFELSVNFSLTILIWTLNKLRKKDSKEINSIINWYLKSVMRIKYKL